MKQFLKDFPSVNELLGKCYNAGCYHGNPYPELLYHISKQNGFLLKRLDYNEPQKGKDQCDRDSALARNTLRIYVEEGNDIMNAGDTVNALSQVSIKNASISEVEFDNTEWFKEMMFQKYQPFIYVNLLKRALKCGATMT